MSFKVQPCGIIYSSTIDTRDHTKAEISLLHLGAKTNFSGELREQQKRYVIPLVYRVTPGCGIDTVSFPRMFTRPSGAIHNFEASAARHYPGAIPADAVFICVYFLSHVLVDLPSVRASSFC